MADRGIPLPVLLDASARLWLRFALLLGLGLGIPALAYQRWSWREVLPLVVSLALLSRSRLPVPPCEGGGR